MKTDPKWDDLAPDAARDSFAAVATWIDEASQAEQRSGRVTLRRLAYAAGITVVFAFACAVPVKQTNHLGWLISLRVSGTTADASAMVASAEISDALVFAKPRAGNPPSTDLAIAGVSVSRDVAEGWTRAIRSLPGGETAELSPLTDTVESPAYKVAARAFGIRYAPSLDRTEIERRIATRLTSLGGGSIAVKIDRPRGGSELLVVPGDPDAPLEMEANPNEVVLMILRRKTQGPPDTVWLPLDGAAYNASDEAQRTRLIRRALSERNIRGVEVEFERGVVVIRVKPTRD